MDEKAIIDRIWVWVIPINAPNRAEDRAMVNIGIDEILLVKDKEKSINKGASFCQKDSMKQSNQLEEFITEGNHWWNGTTASFIKIPSIIKI